MSTLVKVMPRKSPSTQPKGERLAVSVKEAAYLLSVSERTLFDWMKQKKIPSLKIGGRVLLPIAGLKNFLETK